MIWRDKIRVHSPITSQYDEARLQRLQRQLSFDNDPIKISGVKLNEDKKDLYIPSFGDVIAPVE